MGPVCADLGKGSQEVEDEDDELVEEVGEQQSATLEMAAQLLNRSAVFRAAASQSAWCTGVAQSDVKPSGGKYAKLVLRFAQALRQSR